MYYSFAYSRLQYGIIICGTAAKTQIFNIEVRKNTILRIIACNKKNSHLTHLYEKLNILKLKDICELVLAKFMHKLYNNKLPQFLQNRFCRSDRVHLFKTRINKNSNYYLPRMSKTIG